jgi:hypothetical protein
MRAAYLPPVVLAVRPCPRVLARGAGGGKQHWELVAKGNELTLHVLDADEKPIAVDGGSAKGQVLIGGKRSIVATGSPQYATKSPVQMMRSRGIRNCLASASTASVACRLL